MAKNPYSVLGVARDADQAAIKRAYRKLAKANHPDQNKDNPAAIERFKEASAAYAIVGDAAQRAKFDAGEIDADGNPRAAAFAGSGSGGFGGRGSTYGRTGGGPQGGFGGDPFDLFADLFGASGPKARPGGGFAGGAGPGGSARQQAARGVNISYELTVPFMDAVELKPQRLTLKNGSAVEIKLPVGFADGQQLKLAGKGMPGPGGAGDAMVTLKVGQHPYFTRDGAHVRLDLPVTLAEAVLGAKIKVPTPAGTVLMTIPAGTSSGKILRIPGKGFNIKPAGGPSSRGDQLVRVQIHIPPRDAGLEKFVKGWTPEGADPRKHFGLDMAGQA